MKWIPVACRTVFTTWEVEVIVNGRVVSKRTQRVNKAVQPGRGAGAAGVAGMGRQFSYGSLVREREKTRPAKESWLGRPFGRVAQHLSWAATGYG